MVRMVSELTVAYYNILLDFVRFEEVGVKYEEVIKFGFNGCLRGADR